MAVTQILAETGVDQSFVRDFRSERVDLKIVAAVISLGKNLEMDVLSEGVDTAQQLSVLRGLNCDYAQGYYFGRPVERAKIPRFFTKIPA